MGEGVFTIEYGSGGDFTVEEVWPDGDAPEDPTSEDVVRLIRKLYRSPGDLVREWGMGDDTLTVDGIYVWGPFAKELPEEVRDDE